MFLISFSARATDEEWENFRVMKKSRPARSCAREFLKIHISFRAPATGSTLIQISPPILTCSKLWHDCERARERQDERNGVRGWRNSTVKWHRSRRRTPKKKVIILVHHSSHRTDTLHIPPYRCRLTCALCCHHQHHRHASRNWTWKEGRTRDDNKLFWYFLLLSFVLSLFFTSTAFSCVQFYGISGSASWWQQWCCWYHEQAGCRSLSQHSPRTRNHFYRISHTEIVKPSRFHFKLHFASRSLCDIVAIHFTFFCC